MTGMNGADFQGKMKESETLRQEHEKRAGTKRTMKDRVLSGCSLYCCVGCTWNDCVFGSLIQLEASLFQTKELLD